MLLSFIPNPFTSIYHKTEKFFSIDGIKVKTNWNNISYWEQPIISQPEIGYLGFIAKEIDGILHLLVQAKIEPGNINNVQLSPTLQATRSNYLQVHKGKKPLYLEYFQEAKSNNILLDQLQSEQGSRFYKKRNRNIIIKVDKEFNIENNFIWLTIGQIKSLMKFDNVVNMDTRTVISGISYGHYNQASIPSSYIINMNHKIDFLSSAMIKDQSLHSIEDIITFITHYKSNYDLEISKVPLYKMKDWDVSEYEIYHKENKYFKVIAVDVEIDNREVVNWCQPMIEPAQEGLCAFICKKIKGILHFLVQAKLECGNLDVIELAPTVQCLTGNYKENGKNNLPFLEYVLTAKKDQIYIDTMQSEEGGRFYQEQNRNMIVIADEQFNY